MPTTDTTRHHAPGPRPSTPDARRSASASSLGPEEVDEGGHEHRRQRPGGQQLEQHVGDRARGLVGVAQVGGAEHRGDHPDLDEADPAGRQGGDAHPRRSPRRSIARHHREPAYGGTASRLRRRRAARHRCRRGRLRRTRHRRRRRRLGGRAAGGGWALLVSRRGAASAVARLAWRPMPTALPGRRDVRCSTSAARSPATRCSRSPRSPSTSSPTSSRSRTGCGSRTAGPRSSSRASSTPSRARAPRTARSARSRPATRTDVDVYPFLDLDEVLAAAHATTRRGRHPVLHRGRGARARGAAARARSSTRSTRCTRETGLEVACSLGLLTAEQAQRLAAAGVRRYNHNLEACRERCSRRSARPTPTTTASPPPASPSTRAWSCAAAGSSAWARRSSSGSTSRSSSPSSNRARCRSTSSTPDRARRSATSALITPREALQAIALFRLVLPGAWLRLAGGREHVLGELQAMGLLAGRQRADRRQLPHVDRPSARGGPRAARRARHAGRRRPGRRPLRRRRRRRARRAPRSHRASGIPVRAE